MESYNQEYMDPPLNANEVIVLQKQVRANKTDGTMKYIYKCNDQPIVSVCQKSLCKMRKYGIGQSSIDHPTYSELSCLGTVPPIWFLNVGNERVELYRMFRVPRMSSRRLFDCRFKKRGWSIVRRGNCLMLFVCGARHT